MLRIIILVCVILLASSLLIYEICTRRKGVGEELTQLRLDHNGVMCEETEGHVIYQLDLDNLPPCITIEMERVGNGGHVQAIVVESK